MNYDYDPESAAISPPLSAIVNAKHRDNLFVYLFRSNISAMILRRLEVINPSVPSVNVGDFLVVQIQFNQRSTEKHKSRHEVITLEKMELPPSIKRIFTVSSKDSEVAVIEAVVQAGKDGILNNEYIGTVVNAYNEIPREIIRSTHPFLAELKVQLLPDGTTAIVCSRFLGKYKEKPEKTVDPIIKECKGVIRSFDGFNYLVWSPDYNVELVLLPKILDLPDYLGKWISFNTVRTVRDALHIEGELKVVDSVYRTEIKENTVEIYANCIVSGYYNRRMIITIEGTSQHITPKGLDDMNPEQFPCFLWLTPSFTDDSIWDISLKSMPRHADSREMTSAEIASPVVSPHPFLNHAPQPEVDRYQGVILDVIENKCYVWCPGLLCSKDLFCDTKYFDSSLFLPGKWISFDVSRELERFRIHHPRIIADMHPTRYNKKSRLVELEVTCDSEEVPDKQGHRVYTSNDIGLIVDFDDIFDDSTNLPFTAWVVASKAHTLCRWMISKCNRPAGVKKEPVAIGTLFTDTSFSQSKNSSVSTNGRRERSPDGSPPPGISTSRRRRRSSSVSSSPGIIVGNRERSHNMHLASMNGRRQRSPDVSPPPGIVADKVQPQNGRPQPAAAPRPVDYARFIKEANNDGGKFTDDEEDEGVINKTYNGDEELSSTSTKSRDSEDDEVCDLLNEMERHSTENGISESMDFSEMTLKELCRIMLENREYCMLFERVDKELYHAFVNKARDE